MTPNTVHPRWPFAEWLKMAALLFGVGAAMIGALSWAWGKLETPEIMARAEADARIEQRVAGVADSVRYLYGEVGTKMDRILKAVEKKR